MKGVEFGGLAWLLISTSKGFGGVGICGLSIDFSDLKNRIQCELDDKGGGGQRACEVNLLRRCVV